MILPRLLLEIRPIDRNLLKGIQFPFQSVTRVPEIRFTALEQEHPVIPGRKGKIAEHVRLRQGTVQVRVCGEDKVPFLNIVELLSPYVLGAGFARGRVKDGLGVGVVPVSVPVDYGHEYVLSPF